MTRTLKQKLDRAERLIVDACARGGAHFDAPKYEGIRKKSKYRDSKLVEERRIITAIPFRGLSLSRFEMEGASVGEVMLTLSFGWPLTVRYTKREHRISPPSIDMICCVGSIEACYLHAIPATDPERFEQADIRVHRSCVQALAKDLEGALSFHVRVRDGYEAVCPIATKQIASVARKMATFLRR